MTLLEAGALRKLVGIVIVMTDERLDDGVVVGWVVIFVDMVAKKSKKRKRKKRM